MHLNLMFSQPVGDMPVKNRQLQQRHAATVVEQHTHFTSGLEWLILQDGRYHLVNGFVHSLEFCLIHASFTMLAHSEP